MKAVSINTYTKSHMTLWVNTFMLVHTSIYVFLLFFYLGKNGDLFSSTKKENMS